MIKRVSLIGAFSRMSAVYGTKSGKMPFRSKTDMAFFKETTTGGAVIMGRSTWESLPPKFRPLPDRQNIVVSSNTGLELSEGVQRASNLSEAIALSERDEIFLIGGKKIWEEGLKIADILYITEVGWSPVKESEEQYLSMPMMVRADTLMSLGFHPPNTLTRIDEDISSKPGTLTFATYHRV